MFYPFKPGRARASKAAASPNKNQVPIGRQLAERLGRCAQKLPPKKLKMLLGAAGAGACVAAAMLVIGGFKQQQTRNGRFDFELPGIFESITVPQSPSRQQATDDYLDSLQKAFLQDSIENAQHPHDYEPTRLP